MTLNLAPPPAAVAAAAAGRASTASSMKIPVKPPPLKSLPVIHLRKFITIIIIVVIIIIDLNCIELAVELLRRVVGRSSVAVGNGSTSASAFTSVQSGSAVALSAFRSLLLLFRTATLLAPPRRQTATARRSR